MQSYKNTTQTSCVWDAFHLAGLPTEDWMMNGVMSDRVVDILIENGWKMHKKGSAVSPKKPFLVIRDYKSDFHHIEYHETIDTVLDYDASSIGAVFTKE